MVLGKWSVPLHGARGPLAPSSGQGPPGHSPSPARCRRRLHGGAKPHICSRVQVFWKSPACSGLEPAQRWARRPPGAGCCWQSNQCSSLPNILFSKQHLHAKQGGGWNIRGRVSWQPCGKTMPLPGGLQPFLPHSHSQPPPSDAMGMPTFFQRGKQGRTNQLHRLNTTPGLRHLHPS